MRRRVQKLKSKLLRMRNQMPTPMPKQILLILKLIKSKKAAVKNRKMIMIMRVKNQQQVIAVKPKIQQKIAPLLKIQLKTTPRLQTTSQKRKFLQLRMQKIIKQLSNLKQQQIIRLKLRLLLMRRRVIKLIILSLEPFNVSFNSFAIVSQQTFLNLILPNLFIYL